MQPLSPKHTLRLLHHRAWCPCRCSPAAGLGCGWLGCAGAGDPSAAAENAHAGNRMGQGSCPLSTDASTAAYTSIDGSRLQEGALWVSSLRKQVLAACMADHQDNHSGCGDACWVTGLQQDCASTLSPPEHATMATPSPHLAWTARRSPAGPSRCGTGPSPGPPGAAGQLQAAAGGQRRDHQHNNDQLRFG